MLLRHRGMISILTRRSISPSVSRPKQRIQLQALVLLAAFCAGLVGMVVAGGPASAHATFVSSTTVAVGTDVSFTLDVPHERAEDVFNTVVRIKVPDGWRGISCDPFPTWTCTAGPGEIDFIKDSGAEQAQDETFRFVARANDTGQVAFPVVQIYSTGENVLWQDTAIVMADGGDPPITEVPAVPTTRGDDSGPAGAPFSPAVADEDPVVVGSAGGSDPGPNSTPSSDSTVSRADVRALDATVAGDDGTAPSSGEGSSSGLMIVVVAAAVLTAAGAATFVVIRRRSGS
ncbi:MAG: DUF1775 domain-containing protein [Actinobacteria bacterium]|uniref:Unannotated protein n=1 Tax=freshwater metagenome TaxID=449393 RepID=A0A6J5YDQ8_9ZZZZ|nr:DUF1775 domain-containing protein [Actinomycetota bacterium]